MKTEQKESIIKKLQDEVNDLHPFLKDLFKKIRSIKYSEYTHGQREFGTDFILISCDDILNTEKYIGIIVKSKSIKQNDMEEIERQLNEAFKMPKKIDNGRRTIRISSAWVITSNTISNNAIEKIGEYFRDKDVSFIDFQKLTNMVDEHFPEFWSGMSSDASLFITKTLAKISEEDKRFSLIPGIDTSFYIQPDIIKISKPENTKFKKEKWSTSSVVDLNAVIEKERIIIIEAPMGYGKSKLFREITKYYLNPEIYREKKILALPIKYSEICVLGENIIESLPTLLDMPQQEINKHELVILLIDGFDEVSEKIEDKINSLKRFESITYENSKLHFVVSTRGFMGVSDFRLKTESIRKYEIKALTLNKVILFLEKICSSLDLKNSIIEDLKKSPLLKELPKSPIAAILLARLFEQNAKDLPSNLPELYSMYLELVLGKWDVEKGLCTLKEYDVARGILYHVSELFIDSQCDSLDLTALSSIISDYISSRNYPIEPKKIENLLTERSGILTKNEKENKVYYVHRSFIEYFYAESKARENSLSFDKDVYNISKINIFYFYIGIKKDCENLLKLATDFPCATEFEKIIKFLNIANFYMAGHGTPYSFVKNHAHEIFIEAALYYDEMIKSRKSNFFDRKPQILVLWWMQYILKSSFGYDYFKNALEDIMFKIEEQVIGSEIKVIAIFFLSSVGLRLKSTSVLRYLIQKYPQNLPAEILIGISGEIEVEKATDAELNKKSKWIERKIRDIDVGYKKVLMNEPLRLDRKNDSEITN